jgi:hypothetical protein
VASALVLELVEGPTLADRLAHGPLELAEALPIRQADRGRARGGTRARASFIATSSPPTSRSARRHREGARFGLAKALVSASSRSAVEATTRRRRRGRPRQVGRSSARRRTCRRNRHGQGRRSAGRHLGVRRRSLRDAVGAAGLHERGSVRQSGGGAEPGSRLGSFAGPRRLRSCGACSLAVSIGTSSDACATSAKHGSSSKILPPPKPAPFPHRRPRCGAEPFPSRSARSSPVR